MKQEINKLNAEQQNTAVEPQAMPVTEKKVNHRPMLFAMARKALEKIGIEAEDFIKEYNAVIAKTSKHSANKRRIIKEIGDIITTYDSDKVYTDREIAVMCTRIVSCTIKDNPWSNY